MKRLKENVHAIQVGCQNCGGAHLDKDFPLNEQVKSVEEAKYGEFRHSSPFSNGAKYRVGPLGYYIRIENRPPFGEKRPSLEELMNKHLEESMRRRAEMEEWVKNLQENAVINTRNQSASLKKFGDPNRAANKGKTDMLVEMADMTKRSPIGIVEKVLVKIDKFLFPSDFEVMDMLNTRNETMILRRPYLATIHAEIDVFNKEISLEIGESPFLSSTPSYKSSRFKKSDNNYDNHIQEQRSKKTSMLKSNTNHPNTHFCKPVKQICNGILKVLPTCDPTLKACNGGIEVYGINEEGNLNRWYCYLDDDRGSIKGGGLSFPEFLLVKYGEVQKKELIWDNRYEEWCNENSSPDTPTSKLALVQEDYKPRPKDYYFKDWLLTKVGHTKVLSIRKWISRSLRLIFMWYKGSVWA
ncbi:reverse transcriptase domain-containing protein [Tanacetum coccineum]